MLQFYQKGVDIMLTRDFEEKLLSWKNNPHKKALCIFGARQIGKTTTVREFAKKHYEHFCEINFFETPKAKEIFDGDLDANTIIMGISALTKMKLEPKTTLIFFDEIQKCPNARCAIKFLVEDGRFDYIESGSLLGVNVEDIPSLPVGFEEEHNMYPMSFKEFAAANGIQKETFDYLEDCFHNEKPVSDVIHSTMQKLFYAYLVVGGMPEAVQVFLDTHDIARVIEYQTSILSKYRQDISQYAPQSDKVKIKAIFDSIPAQLAQKNRRFMVNSVDKNARLLRYQDSFNWLVDAGVALPCYNTSAPIMPLALNEKRSLFKLFSNDVGLLCAASMSDIQFDLLQGDVSVNLGSVLENAIAQELRCNGFELRYYDSNKSGEVDFVIKLGSQVVVVEAKSGNDYTEHTALKNVLKVTDWNIEKAIVLCKGNVENKGVITYLPWYMMMFIKQPKIDKMIYNIDIQNIVH